MGDKTNLQLKPIEGSALYRRRMLDEKYNTGIEESEELEHIPPSEQDYEECLYFIKDFELQRQKNLFEIKWRSKKIIEILK